VTRMLTEVQAEFQSSTCALSTWRKNGMPMEPDDLSTIEHSCGAFLEHLTAAILKIRKEDYQLAKARGMERTDTKDMTTTAWESDEGQSRYEAYKFILSCKSFIEDAKDLGAQLTQMRETAKAEGPYYMLSRTLSQWAAGWRQAFEWWNFAAALKVSIAEILMSILAAVSLDYRDIGVAMVVFIMTGDQTGNISSSFKRSFNRIGGIVAGLVFPDILDLWMPCKPGVHTGYGATLFIWLFICGIVYGGAVKGWEYAGMIAGYVGMMQLLGGNICSGDKAAIERLQDSFIAMLIVMFAEMFILPTPAKAMLLDDLRQYWQALALDEDNVLDKVFSLYLEPLPDLANLSRAHSMALDTGSSAVGPGAAGLLLTRQGRFEELEKLHVSMDALEVTSRAHLELARHEPGLGRARFPAEVYDLYTKSLFQLQENLFSIANSMRAAENEMMSMRRVGPAGDTDVSYHKRGSDNEVINNPLLIADADMMQMLSEMRTHIQEYSQQMMDVLTAGKIETKDWKDWGDLGRPIGPIIKQHSVRYDALIKAAKVNGVVNYPNKKIFANHTLQKELDTVALQQQHLLQALCGIHWMSTYRHAKDAPQ